MNLNRLQKPPFTLIVYLANLAAGAAQFLCLVYLQRLLPREDFSVVSLVMSYFAPYLLALELGIQAELIRRFALARNSAHAKESTSAIFATAVILRLFASAATLPVAAMSAYAGGASPLTIFAIVIFLTSFFPSAWLLSLEPLGFVLKKRSFASGLKIARTIGLFCFAAALYFIEELGNQAAHRHFWIALSFSLFVAVSFLYILQFVPVEFGLRSVWLHWSCQAASPFKQLGDFVKESASLIFGRLINFAYGLVFLTFILKLHGENHLAEFNMATTLNVPYTLFASVMVNRSTSRVYAEGKSFLHELIFFCLISVCFISAYATAYYLLPIQTVFKDLHLDELAFYLWPLLASQIFAAITSLFIQKSQGTKAHRLAIENPLFLLLLVAASGALYAGNLPPIYAGFWALFVNLLGTTHAAWRYAFCTRAAER